MRLPFRVTVLSLFVSSPLLVAQSLAQKPSGPLAPTPNPKDGDTQIVLKFVDKTPPADLIGDTIHVYPVADCQQIQPSSTELVLAPGTNHVVLSVQQTTVYLKSPLNFARNPHVCVVLTPSRMQSAIRHILTVDSSFCKYQTRLTFPKAKPAVKADEEQPKDLIAPAAPPTDPNAVADASTATEGVTFATKTADSFKKEVSVTLGVVARSTCSPPGDGDNPVPFAHRLGKKNSRYILNLNFTYDDQWKDGAPALSTITQSYAALAINLSDLLYFHTSLLASEYHNNQQGIVLEQEYGIGWYLRILAGKPRVLPDAPPATGTPTARNTFLLAPQIRMSFDELKTQGDAASVGEGIYLEYAFQATKSLTLTNVFKGYVPFTTPLVNGRASTSYNINYKITKQLSYTFEVSDSYFATVPTGYRPNSLTSSMGIKYNPKPTP